MPAKLKDQFQTRIFILSAFFLIWSFLLVFRLVNLQIFQYQELSSRAKRQQSRSFKISPKRGTIYDRHGRELAVSVSVDSIYAIPSEIADKPHVAEKLAGALNLRSQELLSDLKGARNFAWIKRKVDYSDVVKVKNLGLPGIYFEKENKRFYPNRELAAHILGYVGMDNEGLGGLEFAYENQIGGTPGRVLLLTDARQRSFSSVEKAPTPGRDLVLAIDQTIQYLTEQELAAQIKKSSALAGTAIVMDPHSGDILAMASYPTFNPNHYAKYPPDQWKNRSIVSIYEPGSTFKIITAATALEERLTRPDETIDCRNGSIVVGKYRIRDHKKYGVLSVREIVVYSSNVGAVQLGFRIGKERFEKHIRDFGFGAPTEVDLPGEAKGLLRSSSQWPMITLANISMGQGIGVTPLQLVTAVSSIANGGYRVKPHLVQQARTGSIERVSYEPGSARQRILTLRTTEMIKEMLTGVVTHGTGKDSQLEGFTAAGKTGTAQKLEPNGRYSHSRFIASFVGFAPIDHPSIAIVVTIDEPHGLYYGGQVAAPVFKNIAEKTLRYMSISPDQPLTPLQMAKHRKQGKNEVTDLTSDQFELLDASWEMDDAERMEEPKASRLQSRLPVEVNDKQSESLELSDSATIEVPDFRGRSLRTVMLESAKLGLQLGILGSGMVIEQSPAPASKVEPGSKIMIKLNRQP